MTERERGPVAAAAESVVRTLGVDHGAAQLLQALVERLAECVDAAVEVRDVVAASREIRELVKALDPALPPPPPTAPGVDEGEGGGGADDPFGIGSGPPALGDPA